MDERDLIINLAFKPLVSGLKLTPEQSQLILSHIGELLQGVEEEAGVIVEEERKQNSDDGEQKAR